ncbi:hypothetical protein DNH61_09800 [Paenibacillus sambharensis]|uniref:Uncharacterized protein n=1 Tax=Paenibacillus sambharensis TaxID=1803190 RepID=A0A2W1LMS0_9BACL|nr:hypothetical protein [Paenibacillus sambharensis]PZD96185.1 hypothetical protein DNH61_09800 [Paenibacillus sambharensis]
MKVFRYDERVGKPIEHYGSREMRITPIMKMLDKQVSVKGQGLYMDLRPRKKLTYTLVTCIISLFICSFQLIVQVMVDGPLVLVVLFYVISLFLCVTLTLTAADLFLKEYRAVKARVKEIDGSYVTFLLASGKEYSLNIKQPEYLEQLHVDQIVAVRLTRMMKIPSFIEEWKEPGVR